MSGSYTQTPNLGLFKPTPNSDTGTWGIHLNSNADVLDSALGPSGLFLPLSGGTVNGVTTFTSGINVGTAQVTVTTPTGAAIQAAINALPATGGTVTLLANTTYVVTAAILSSTPNVHISAPSWNTVIQRGPSLAGIMFDLEGAGCLIEGITFDGNGSVNTSGGQSEVKVGGANSRITNCQVINSASVINVSATGAGCRVDHCTITGLGISLSTQRGYGIWAINHVQVFIEHNKITGTGIDGIGVDGPGSVVDGNTVSGCHCYTGGPGGQVCVYAGPGVTVSNNYIGQGGSSTVGGQSGGMELYGNYITCTGNTIVNQYGGGIAVEGTGYGFTITGNTIQNVGLDMTTNEDGIVVHAGITDFVVTGNRIGDDAATPNMRWCIVVLAGASDRYTIAGNICGPCNRPLAPISDSGTGTHKTIYNNMGVETAVPVAYSAAALPLPLSSVFHIWTTGTLGITSITGAASAAAAPYGTVKTAIPNAAFTFTAGNNIGNTVTTVANVPLLMVCDETGKWWLK